MTYVHERASVMCPYPLVRRYLREALALPECSTLLPGTARLQIGAERSTDAAVTYAPARDHLQFDLTANVRWLTAGGNATFDGTLVLLRGGRHGRAVLELTGYYLPPLSAGRSFDLLGATIAAGATARAILCDIAHAIEHRYSADDTAA